MGPIHLASDPEVNQRLVTHPKFLEAFMAFPLPGAAQAFFVDTIKRVPSITAPTLVIWGEEDQLDPPETARRLFAALTCKKRLEIISGNGHAGHLDRQKQKVFELTSEWILENLT
jgi:pimeloyl-ACP methyl ester carboxylesterase